VRHYLALVAALLLSSGCDLFSRHETTRFAINGDVLDVAVRNDTLLVGVGDSGLLVFDIARPWAPREMLHVVPGRRCLRVLWGADAVYAGTDSGVALWTPGSNAWSWLYSTGASQTVTGMALGSDRLYVSFTDGIGLFEVSTGSALRFVPLPGNPTDVALHDSRLLVALRDRGACLFDLLPGDSLEPDTLFLGRHNRAEGVAFSASGHCIVSQGDSGVTLFYSPAADTIRLRGAVGPSEGRSAYGVVAVNKGEEVVVYVADSTDLTTIRMLDKADTFDLSAENRFPGLEGFTRRVCMGGNGFVYTASGDAGVYIIRQ
jgi:hypothetical protein